MRIKLLVHSHDTALPEHDQVHFHTPEHPGGLMVLRLPKGAPLPPIGREYTADFVNQEEALQQDEHHQKALDAAYEQGKQFARNEASQPQKPLPPIGREYTADFVNQEEALQQDEHHQKALDAAYEQGKQFARNEASQPQKPPEAGQPADRSADTLGKVPTTFGKDAQTAARAAAVERFDDEHGPAGSDQGGA